MPTVKELLEKKAPLVKEIRRLADLFNTKDHKATADENANWDKVNADYAALEADIERTGKLERASALEVDLARPAPALAILPGRDDRGRRAEGAGELGDEDPSEEDLAAQEDEDFRGKKNVLRMDDSEEARHAFTGWARFHRYGATKRQEAACRKLGIDPRASHLDLKLIRGDYAARRREFRAPMGTGAGIGGDTIPQGFVNAFERAMLYFGGMRDVATIIRTDTGNALPYPTTNDTGNMGELLAENTGAALQDVVTAAITFNAFKYSSKLVKVSTELLQDSAFDLPAILGSMLGERIGRITNTHFTTGTGTGQPNGIVTASTQGAVLANSTTNVTAFTAPDGGDGFFRLIHSIDPAYRRGGNIGFMTSDTALGKIRQLKDTTNQYIWQASMLTGVPDRLLGYPITINNDVAVPAANAKSVLFGNFSKYIIRDVIGFRIRRLVERFADVDQEAFIAFLRTDGDLLDAGVKPVKHLAMAAS